MNTNLFDFKIDHIHWAESVNILFTLLSTASPGEVVVVTGPSRGGKTRLVEYILSLLSSEYDADKRYKTSVVVDAVNSGPDGRFSTKAFMIRLLAAVEHPFLSLKYCQTTKESEIVLQKIQRTTESAMRETLERALIALRVRFLFIDEAQHIQYVSKNAQAAHAVMDSWKCLAKDANVVLVIVGAYPILDVLHKSPHMLGRKHQVHLKRYSQKKDELEAFIGIIKAYEKKLPNLTHLRGF